MVTFEATVVGITVQRVSLSQVPLPSAPTTHDHHADQNILIDLLGPRGLDDADDGKDGGWKKKKGEDVAEEMHVDVLGCECAEESDAAKSQAWPANAP